MVRQDEGDYTKGERCYLRLHDDDEGIDGVGIHEVYNLLGRSFFLKEVQREVSREVERKEKKSGRIERGIKDKPEENCNSIVEDMRKV